MAVGDKEHLASKYFKTDIFVFHWVAMEATILPNRLDTSLIALLLLGFFNFSLNFLFLFRSWSYRHSQGNVES